MSRASGLLQPQEIPRKNVSSAVQTKNRHAANNIIILTPTGRVGTV